LADPGIEVVKPDTRGKRGKLTNMKPTINEVLARVSAFEEELPSLVLPAGHPGSVPMAAWIDHTLLKPEATPDQIEKLCQEAQGATLTQAKVDETRHAIEAGAKEIDMVIPVGLLRGGEYAAVAEDIAGVVEMSHAHGAHVKVILEMALLNRKEKIAGCLLSQAAGADFVKTSTGFGPGGATLEDVELMRRVVGPQMGIKAAGGIRSLADARAMLAAGATRLGTSAGVKIVQEAK
jgi:deoxyribose-phosphate aldolase